MENRIKLASAFVIFSLVAGLFVFSAGISATSQDQPGIIRTSLQVTARTLNFHGTNRNMWSWVPYVRFSLTRARGSGDQHYIEYTIPGAGPALKFDCELNQRGDGFECGGRSIPEEKGSIYTGPVNFAIKVRNELRSSRPGHGLATIPRARLESGWSECAFGGTLVEDRKHRVVAGDPRTRLVVAHRDRR